MSRLDWSRLHSKILRSSVWLEKPMVRLVWICALADSETNGTFYGSEEALARAWNLPEDVVKDGLARLCEPDPRSSTPDHEGRRIERVSSTEWRIFNKRLYNPSGEPQGASTERVRRFRSKKETDETGNDSNAGNALEEIREEEKRKRGASSSKRPGERYPVGPPEHPDDSSSQKPPVPAAAAGDPSMVRAANLDKR